MNAAHTIGTASRLLGPFIAKRDEARKARDQRSFWLFPDPTPAADTGSMFRSTLRGAIREVWESVKRDGWDGDGATAVSDRALEEALRLADAIPASVEAPTVSAEADGYITFEWYRSKERQLSISIGGKHILYFAGRVDDKEPAGEAQFWDKWPSELDEPLGKILSP